MGTTGRSAPLRRTGSLLGLLGLELAAVLGLHWLGRHPGLRVRWDAPVPWLLSSPVQEILGALLRMVGLAMAYWLLASTLLYLLASLTRLPSAVRAVGWMTLPPVRRVADHALAVTLATSMVGGGSLAMAAPAMAQDPPGQTTTTTRPKHAYVPNPAGDPPQEEPELRKPAYVPQPGSPGTERSGDRESADPGERQSDEPNPPSSNPPSSNPPSGNPANPPSTQPKDDQAGEPRNEDDRDGHRVRPGDNLWTIARAELTRAHSGGAGEPSNREVAAYWVRLVELNRPTLWSGDPDLIYPKEWIKLPPVDD